MRDDRDLPQQAFMATSVMARKMGEDVLWECIRADHCGSVTIASGEVRGFLNGDWLCTCLGQGDDRQEIYTDLEFSAFFRIAPMATDAKNRLSN